MTISQQQAVDTLALLFSTADSSNRWLDEESWPSVASVYAFPHWAVEYRGLVTGVLDALCSSAPSRFGAPKVIGITCDASGARRLKDPPVEDGFSAALRMILGAASEGQLPHPSQFDPLLKMTAGFPPELGDTLRSSLSDLKNYVEAEQEFFLKGDGPAIGTVTNSPFLSTSDINALSRGFIVNYRTKFAMRPCTGSLGGELQKLLRFASGSGAAIRITGRGLQDVQLRHQVRSMLLRQCAFLLHRGKRLFGAADPIGSFFSAFRCLECIADLILVERGEAMVNQTGRIYFRQSYKGLQEKYLDATSRIGGAPGVASSLAALQHFIKVRNSALLAHGFLGMPGADVAVCLVQIQRGIEDACSALNLDQEWLAIFASLPSPDFAERLATTLHDDWLLARKCSWTPA